MKIVTVEKSGNKYGLALGPQIMGGLVEVYKEVLPEDTMEKVEAYAKNMNKSAIEIITNEEELKQLAEDGFLAWDDFVKLSSATQKQPVALLRATIRSFNGHRLGNIPYFKEQFDEEELKNLSSDEKKDIFFEEIMPPQDTEEVIGEINNAVFKYRTGLGIEEKSKLLSQLKEEEEASNQKLLQSQA